MCVPTPLARSVQQHAKAPSGGGKEEEKEEEEEVERGGVGLAVIVEQVCGW